MSHLSEPLSDFDRALAEWFELTVPEREPEDLLERILETTAATHRRPAWLKPGIGTRLLPGWTGLAGRTVALTGVLALLILAGAIALAMGSRPKLPLPLGTPGLLIAARDGELLLLDQSGVVKQRVSTGDFFGAGTWSRDGSRLARLDGTTERPVLVVSDPALNEIVRIPLPAGAEPLVSWSPDGRHIAFSVETDVWAAVMVVDVAAGATPVTITDGGLHAIRPSWSPDGSLIAFRAGVEIDKRVLDVVRPDGTGLRQLSVHGRAVEPYCGFPWSPDGRSVLFSTSYNGVWIVDSDGGNEHQILAPSVQAYCPSMSPDGLRIAATVETATGKRVQVATILGTHVVTPPGPLSDMWPALWSPDGRAIVLNGRLLTAGPKPRAIVDPDGIAPARTFVLDGDALVVDWQRLAP